MASMWRRPMLYLGLGPDDEYDDYDAGRRAASPRRRRPPRPAGAGPSARRRPPRPHPSGPGRRRRRVRPAAGRRAARAVRRAHPARRRRATTAPKPRAVVRPVPAASHRPSPTWWRPTSFNQAQEVADKFKAQPAGHPEPPGRRPRSVPSPHRLLQRPLLRPRRPDGEGRPPGVPAHARPTWRSRAEERRRLSERGLHDA